MSTQKSLYNKWSLLQCIGVCSLCSPWRFKRSRRCHPAFFRFMLTLLMPSSPLHASIAQWSKGSHASVVLLHPRGPIITVSPTDPLGFHLQFKFLLPFLLLSLLSFPIAQLPLPILTFSSHFNFLPILTFSSPQTENPFATACQEVLEVSSCLTKGSKLLPSEAWFNLTVWICS